MTMRKYMRGVTLTELMIVVVIVSILAMVSYPSYREYAARAKRNEAKACLLQVATQNLLVKLRQLPADGNAAVTESLLQVGEAGEQPVRRLEEHQGVFEGPEALEEPPTLAGLGWRKAAKGVRMGW